MKRPAMFYLYLALSAFSIGVLVYIGAAFHAESSGGIQGESQEYNTGWVFTEKDGSARSLVLPATVHSSTRRGEPVSIVNTLPRDLKSGWELCFSTYHSAAQVFVDGRLIYQFAVNSRYPFGKSPASTAWHFVSLPDNSAGKTVEIRLYSSYERYQGEFNSVLLGTKSANVQAIFRKFLPSIIIGAAVLLVGLLLLPTFFAFRKKGNQARSLLYLGLFSINISISALSETFLLQFFFNNALLLGYIMNFAIMLCPIPYLLFVRDVYAKTHTRSYNILCIASAANFLICVLLQIANILDLPETIYSTHAIILVGLLLSLHTAHENLVKHGDRGVMPFLWGTALLLAFVLVDTVRFYFGRYQDGALFARLGLLFFISFLTVSAVLHVFSMMELGAEARVYQKLAYLDILTGQENRTAFEKEMERLTKEGSLLDITIMVFDLNNLKQVNDGCGHHQGDELIQGAAAAIQSSFRLFGKCYRIGGDEFAVILKKCDEKQRQLCFSDFFEALKAYNNTHANAIEVAYGWADYQPEDGSLLQTFGRADEWMYRRKKRMKQAAEKITAFQ